VRRADSAGTPGAAGDAARLRDLLPAQGRWYATHLERLRARRDLDRMRDLAWLAELRAPGEAEAWREVAEAHALAGEVHRAALAYLRQAEADSGQAAYIQYQIDNLLRAHADKPAARVLDSLTAAFPHRKAVTAEMLESLCQTNRAYASAYRNTLAWLALKRPPPDYVLERAGRYHATGHWDYAAGVLEKAEWRAFPNPLRGLARSLFLRLRYQMEDWAAIAAETGAQPKGVLTEEEDCIAATAAIRLGRPQEALDRLRRFESASQPEDGAWGYRARLLKARALLALGRPAEAAKVLDALKRSPRRKEGTGPILFWQGLLALQQLRPQAAESLLVLASAYTGTEESQRALEYRYWLLLDSGAARTEFFRGLEESPLPPAERSAALDRVPGNSGLWPYARLEKAQILASLGRTDSARAVLDDASRRSADRLLGRKAEALAAYLQERTPEGRAAALARYEDLLIEYQQGVVPEFSRGRIRALKR
jgi:hypothetical protein